MQMADQRGFWVLLGSFLPPLSRGAAVLLGSSPEVHQQPVLERVDGLVGVETRKARLTLGLGLGINRRERQEVVLVAETPNSPDIKKGPLWGYLHSEERERHTEKIHIIIPSSGQGSSDWHPEGLPHFKSFFFFK